MAKTPTGKAATEKPLERYVRILEIVAGFPGGISGTSVGEMLDLPKASAYRLMKSLADVELIEQSGSSTANFKLGRRLERLLFSGASDEWFKVVARPTLQELSEKTGQACFIARLDGDGVRSVDMVAPDNLVRAYIVPGHEIPAHAGASAKAILAFQDANFIASVLDKPLKRFTAATKVDFNVLVEELQLVRKTGVAYCIGEDVDGFAGIAAPIRIDGQRTQHSLCVTGTIQGIIETNRELNVALVKRLAEKLSKILERQFQQTLKITA
ncbi:IclR family transcriptional regulator [Mesorhizobium sp. M7A.F.Ca.US.011.01.1.1]|uniref:IclR family transcriptional regulator n=1 Tax=Mesorhizobium sp. M7A.F.Ca.US.011.01.1.1 TaxID=2496741 RepID=UPI000FCB2401|nr:IclR family transcriptional regulator [Mesorhizobium sp. M7A.F.Ca.US.011.01.1.1]RUX23740.1 IclR family transcriptional regulator [Mesorhizobium sp. M7A.F.Ca.US.011.01.1.1]